MLETMLKRRRSRQNLVLQYHARLDPPRPYLQSVVASIGPTGELLTLWVRAESAAALESNTWSPAGASVAATALPEPADGWVRIHNHGITHEIQLEGVSVAYPALQPLPEGRVVLVGSRCQWRPEGADRNAVVYEPDGGIALAETVGDGVQHVMSTPAGNVWIGYSDEGVFGNFGWGRPGPPPIGASGLIRFDSGLLPQWRFPEDERWGYIADCEALNVVDEEAWACYYTDFPIIRIANDLIEMWDNVLTGISAILVGGSHIALIGGYARDSDRFVEGSLSEEFEPAVAGRVVLAGGQPIPSGTRLIGRGNELHAVIQDVWYKAALD